MDGCFTFLMLMFILGIGIPMFFSWRSKTYKEYTLEKQKNNANIEYKKLLTQHADLIKKFHVIAEKKVSKLDAYGDERWDLFDKELWSFMEKVAGKDYVKLWKKEERAGRYFNSAEYGLLRDHIHNAFITYHYNLKSSEMNLASQEISLEDKKKQIYNDYINNLIKTAEDNIFSALIPQLLPMTDDDGKKSLTIFSENLKKELYNSTSTMVSMKILSEALLTLKRSINNSIEEYCSKCINENVDQKDIFDLQEIKKNTLNSIQQLIDALQNPHTIDELGND